jgi:predicted acyl esterase
MWLHRLRNAPELAADWISHQRYDEFWKHGSVAEDYSAIECPVFAVGGWADAYTNAVPRLLEHLSVPRLGLIGPWGHMFPYEGVPGPAIGFLQEAVRWWDRWLRGIDNGIMDEPLLRAWIQEYAPPATFYAVRPGRWVAEESWPPPSVTLGELLLGGDGSLAEAGEDEAGGGNPSHATTEWLSILGRQECGETAGVWCANGNPDEIAGDQGPDDERSLTFTTAPLEAPLELLGHPVAHLRVRADRPLALVAVRVEDVHPDGSSLLVSWGMLNLTHRDGHESPQPLEPGVEYDVRFESRVCGHRFAPGHRLRLALSPTYWPHAWPSPEPVTLQIAVDGPSVLALPVRMASEDAAGIAFPEPEIAGPQPPRTGSRVRDVHVHSGNRHEIVDTEIHEQTIPATGARYRQSGYDSYSITEGDPLSARVSCEREVVAESDSVGWSVRVNSEMTGDATHFHVTEHFEAAENGAVLLETTRSYAIPRDLA